MKKKKVKNPLVLGLLLSSVVALSACALCHGLDSHHGQEMQDRYWDHSNMQW